LTALSRDYEKWEGEEASGLQYDIGKYMVAWSYAEDAVACRRILESVETEKEVFLGDFVKAVLKIVAIAAEMEKMAEMEGDLVLLSKMREVAPFMLKYVVVNQSLYV
jgi:hypothetical protein